MLSIARLKLRFWRTIRYHRRSLLAFHVYFAILMVTVLVPASAWLITALVKSSGASLVGNEDLLRFLLQPSGLVVGVAVVNFGFRWRCFSSMRA